MARARWVGSLPWFGSERGRQCKAGASDAQRAGEQRYTLSDDDRKEITEAFDLFSDGGAHIGYHELKVGAGGAAAAGLRPGSGR